MVSSIHLCTVCLPREYYSRNRWRPLPNFMLPPPSETTSWAKHLNPCPTSFVPLTGNGNNYLSSNAAITVVTGVGELRWREPTTMGAEIAASQNYGRRSLWPTTLTKATVEEQQFRRLHGCYWFHGWWPFPASDCLRLDFLEDFAQLVDTGFLLTKQTTMMVHLCNQQRNCWGLQHPRDEYRHQLLVTIRITLVVIPTFITW